MIIANGKTEGFNNNKTNGFTIIEVVLVLAIAGLIFLVVFLALPALQKSQRDNARKQDVAKIVAGLSRYLVDHENTLPSPSAYSTGYFSNLAQASYVWVMDSSQPCSSPSRDKNVDSARAARGCKCSDTTGNVSTSSYASVRIGLESGSIYCVDM